MGLLEGELALVTGAGSGIGRATALRLAEEGASVAVCDIAPDAADVVAEQIRRRGVNAVAITADVSAAESAREMVDTAAAALGGLTVLVNNAGTSSLSPIGRMVDEEWDRVVDTCLKGVYAGIRFAVPHLRHAAGGGKVVSTASISGIVPSAGEAHYAAAKAGVSALTKSVAIELGPEVRVNAVAPGTIRTGLTEAQLAIDSEHDRIVGLTPAGRIGEPDDVADVIVFLCSPGARFVTGVTVPVDGGLSLRGTGVGDALRMATELGVFGDDVSASRRRGRSDAAFASDAWLAEVRDRANGDPTFTAAAGGADVALAFEAESEARPLSFALALRDGRIVDAAPGADAVDLTVRAPLTIWRRILEGDLEPAKAFTMQLLALDGDLDRLTDAIPALMRLFELLTEAPPAFPDAE